MNVKLPAVFSNDMVLQHGKPVTVWGWAAPGARVTVAFAGQKKTGVARRAAAAPPKGAPAGEWRVTLAAFSVSSEPRTLTVSAGAGKAILEFRNVLVGDVWVCSGQSNMEWLMANTRNAPEEIAAARYPNLRLFTVPRRADLKPEPDVKGTWCRCSPDTVGGFSAVAYFFGREIHRKTGIPLGLVNTSWGGTRAEAWASVEGLASDKTFRKDLAVYAKEICQPGDVLTRQQEWKKKFDIKDTENRGEADGWHQPGLKLTKWKTMDLPRNWQSAGHLHSGIFWFRRVVDVPAAWAGKELTLSLGALDKSDVSYFNGVQVGSITMEQRQDAWCTPRIYTVPGKLVKAGRNVIAVRVFSNIYHGGFIGTPSQMRLLPAKDAAAKPISLSGPWEYALEANFGLVPDQPAGPRGDGNQNSPHILFDNMIKPLLSFGICGAIWYQGESNAAQAWQYRTLFPLMIRSWRKAWGQGNFSFNFVQLANYQPVKPEPAESAWAELREAQALALELPNTGMAVTIDIGEANDIHPKNKQDVGLRLALPALAQRYGYRNLVYSGPVYQGMTVEKGRIRIRFDHVGGGLVAHGEKLEGFAIAGKTAKGLKFVWAEARIDGDTVVVSSPEVPKPVAVRYAWAENPICNLFNASDLPASPFRTDNQPGITQ